MAIKSRLLSSLKSIYVSLNLAENAHPQKLHPILHRLTEARELCQMGLTEENYAKYGEVYDGLIMAMKQVLSGEAGNETKEILALCKDLLQHIVQETNKEEKFKKEMVFLPYKYSMWDSLESVWRAAYEDKDHCIAYVIPIPYCDRNPDGTAKEWHCERGLFPADIPTLDWRDVDLKAMHPDAIFFHYPYDNCNSATSVDGTYYSFELRGNTDLLVYVPYFVVGCRWPEQHIALPVYEYMDFMVVQQEHMQIAPMRFSEIKEGEEPYLDDFLPKEKIFVAGSPKIDRIYYCEKHPQVPKDWLDYIGGRKVIFYNTSISGALQHRGRYLNKMRYIFATFKQHKEVALIWRPHPLLEASLQSVIPDIYEEYLALKEQYISEKIGIFDDTADLEMTMAISDAYLGETTSSVVSLFGYAGKPVFFTGDYMLWQEPSMEEKTALQIGTHIVDKGMKHSYFLATGYNRFCRMDWETGKIETLLDFGNTPDSKGYTTFLRDENNKKFYFSPNSAKTICIFDEETGERRDIPYENPLEWGNFGAVIKYDHYVYFIPSRYQAIIRLNQETEELTYYRECLEEIIPTVTAEFMQLLGPYTWIKYPNLIYIAALQSNKVMTFDMSTGDYSWQAVGPEDTDCCTILEERYGSGIFWLFPWRKEKIRRWDTHTGECQVLTMDDYPENYQCRTDWWNYVDQYKFSGFIRLDGYIYMLPCYGNMVMRLNMVEKKLEKVDLNLPFGWEDRKSNYFVQQSPITSVGGFWIPGYRPWNDDLPLRPIQFSYDNRLYLYDFHTLTYKEIPCRLTEEQVRSSATPIEQTFERVGKSIPYATGEHRALRNVSEFIEYVASGTHDREKQREAWSELAMNIDGTCGEKIKEEALRRLG